MEFCLGSTTLKKVWKKGRHSMKQVPRAPPNPENYVNIILFIVLSILVML